MADKTERLVLIVFVIAASSVWYFLIPWLHGKQTGGISYRHAPQIETTAPSLDATLPILLTKSMVGPNFEHVVIPPGDARLHPTGRYAGHNRCRTWSNSSTGSAALKAIACP